MPPVIDQQLCNVCGKCVELCESDIFYGSKKGECPSITYPEECWHDAKLWAGLPGKGAIKLRIPLPMMISYK